LVQIVMTAPLLPSSIMSLSWACLFYKFIFNNS
jgi:hypothetical protein